MKKQTAKRPTETASGVGLGLLAYGYVTQVGGPHWLAVVLAIVLAFGPVAVSNFVDAVRE